MKQIAALLIIAGTMASFCAEPVNSALWGKKGEAFTVVGRLPDFSYAGYRSGETPIPTPKVTASVRDLGAKGDGKTDDTAAFRKALASGPNAVIHVPAGRYVITGVLELKQSRTVLRGDGPGKTILFFPKTLNDIKPNWGQTTGGRRTSNYSWSGGFICFMGSFGSAQLATVTAPAKRGSSELSLSDASKIKVGQKLEIRQSDTKENTLARALYDGDPGDMRKLRGKTRISMVAKVTAMKGESVTIEPPLRFDIRQEWQPVVKTFEPTVQDCGLEELTLEFPVTPYKGHFTELGRNGIAMSGVANCWVRNVEMLNADSGGFIGSRFCTLEGLVFRSERKADWQKCTGHHGLTLGGTDNLLTGFDYRMRFIHDITVSNGSSQNVIAAGRGDDLCFDHHKRAPYQNLFTDIDLGAGTRPWKCGGGGSLGKHCGARTTFWGIRAKHSIALPPRRFDPGSLNLVGLPSKAASRKQPGKSWIEAIPPADLSPIDLYQAQLKRRAKTGKRFWD
ncbi:MAG: hypothetical protein HN380_24875 [Victivallales bacterium]|jgi:hypothetical protein|nr:hypothetical protein [Victivallales bacterium]